MKNFATLFVSMFAVVSLAACVAEPEFSEPSGDQIVAGPNGVEIDESVVNTEPRDRQMSGEPGVEESMNVAPGELQTSAETFCWVCGEDPSIRACSSNSDYAFYSCEKRCLGEPGGCYLE